jgi:hypothetical protein
MRILNVEGLYNIGVNIGWIKKVPNLKFQYFKNYV